MNFTRLVFVIRFCYLFPVYFADMSFCCVMLFFLFLLDLFSVR